jgi:sugar phosphate isomerase/epimerase
MHSPEEFNKLFDETGLNNVGIVLDVGHANIEGTLDSFLDKCPERLVELHLSDNMGEQDQHLGVGNGKIDWKNLTTKLRNINFNGIVMIEAVFNVPESITKIKELLS